MNGALRVNSHLRLVQPKTIALIKSQIVVIQVLHINLYFLYFFTKCEKIKLKCAVCTLYSIFTLKVFSTTLQNLL